MSALLGSKEAARLGLEKVFLKYRVVNLAAH